MNEYVNGKCRECVELERSRIRQSFADLPNVGRRGFMAGLGALVATAGLPKIAAAALPTDRRFIMVILRGGLDGLAAVPPYADRRYKSARKGLALTDKALLDLDGFFGLHKAMQPLHGYWKKGQMTVFHAMATPYRERSHFDAQNLLELGSNKPHALHDGWLNRLLSLYGDGGKRLGLAIGQSLPLILHGDVPVGSWYPSGRAGPSDDLMMLVARMYERDEMFHNALMESVAVRDMATDVQGETMPRHRGIDAVLQKQAITAAGKMLTTPDGPRVMTIEIGGWDTHAGQGTDKGGLANKLGRLAQGLDGLARSLSSVWDKTVICVVTEFGRTVAMNGSNGTDHGTAGAGFLLGGAVDGGRVISKWPGLDTAALYQGRDLAPTIDMRRMFKAVLVDHMGIPAHEVEKHVFPASGDAIAFKGLFRV